MLVAPVPALNGATPHWTCTTATSTGRAPLQVLDAPTPFGAPIEVAVTASSAQGPPRPARRPQGGESGERVTQLERSPALGDRPRPASRVCKMLRDLLYLSLYPFASAAIFAASNLLMSSISSLVMRSRQSTFSLITPHFSMKSV